MAGVNITPSTIGGKFTHIVAFFTQPVITSNDGGRVNLAGFNGSGAATSPDSLYTNNGASTAISGTWINLNNSQDLKQDPWTPYPGWRNFALGSCEPNLGTDNYFYADPRPPSSPFHGTFNYFDNEFNGGEAGPDQTALRSAREWVMVPTDPRNGVSDTGSVKCYPANQYKFSPGVRISAFGQIRSYASCYNPLLPASAHPEVDYEAAWDIFGYAHFDNTNSDGSLAISLEIMFWTRNHNQNPNVGVLAETGIDFGDGKLWDLYMTTSTAGNGGVSAKYSYGIFILQPAYQEESGWVDILAGVRYFTMHYVVTSGPGAPANPLDCPLIQITRGWEVCSTNYTPLQFRHLDYRLLIAQSTGTSGPVLTQPGRPVRARVPRRARGTVRSAGKGGA